MPGKVRQQGDGIQEIGMIYILVHQTTQQLTRAGSLWPALIIQIVLTTALLFCL